MGERRYMGKRVQTPAGHAVKAGARCAVVGPGTSDAARCVLVRFGEHGEAEVAASALVERNQPQQPSQPAQGPRYGFFETWAFGCCLLASWSCYLATCCCCWSGRGPPSLTPGDS